MPKYPKIVFPRVYVLNKPKTMKKYIGGPSRGEIYGGRPAGAHIPLFWGEEGENDRRSTGTPPNLACGPMICVKVWCKV